jgi:putative transposase
MCALANTMVDKVAFCSKHDIQIEHDQWPVIGKPEAIIGDKGEMIGRTVEIVSEALHIEIQNSPAYRADWKGVVERHFKTLQLTFKPYVEGYVTGVISKKRGGPDYRLDAELTLSDVSKIIINCVLEYNNSHAISDYDPDKDMPPELPHNPLALWNWGIKHRTGKLRSVNEDLVGVNLLPHKESTVTEQGIKLFGCLYSTALAIREGWFHRIDAGPKKVLVAYDPHLTNRIYLRPSGKYDDYIVCELTERSREYRNLTFWDVWRIRKIKAETAANARLTKTKGRLSLDAAVEKIVADARAKNPDTSMLSKASRTKGIRENRSAEINEQRTLNSGLMPKNTDIPASRSGSDNVVYLTDKKPSSFDVPDMLDDLYGDGLDD